MKASGSDFKTEILNDIQFKKALLDKLIEEVKELKNSTPANVLNELADILEVIKTIASNNRIKFPDLENYRKEKRKKRGGYTKKIFLIWSTS